MARPNRRQTGLQKAAAATAVGAFQVWRWLQPHLRTLRSWAFMQLVRALRWAMAHRSIVVGLGVRVAWWSALALLLWGSRTLVSLQPGVDGIPQEAALNAFIGGLALCAVGVMLAPSRSVRWLSSAQGLMHAWCGLVTWIALGG